MDKIVKIDRINMEPSLVKKDYREWHKREIDEYKILKQTYDKSLKLLKSAKSKLNEAECKALEIIGTNWGGY